ncbi:MAG: HD-GYP domain-containing protein [Acidiferrobacteraceae bacterium]
MRKKVDIADLKPGMYISALDRPWTETPFLFQGFTIDSQEQIDELRGYCNYVFVDDLSSARPAQERRIEIELFRKTAQDALAARTSQSRRIEAFETELQRIEKQYQKFMGVVDDFMNDVRMGRSLDIAPVKETVHQAVASILRNPDALVCLTQLQGKSRSTALHSMRVAILSIAFAHHLQLPLPILHAVGIGTLLHDVGKSQLPEDLINKTGALTFAEQEQMKRHVELGVAIVAATPDIPAEAIEAVALHHEYFDGSGYPEGIRKPSSVVGQIAALVNHYDNVTSGTPGHNPISPHAALLHLYAQRDQLFERSLVERFTQCVGIYPIGSLVQLSTGHVGVVTALNRDRFLRPKVALVVDDQGHRYTPAKIVNLADKARDESARPWEIKSVLPPANFDLISAADLAALAADATR